MPDLICVSFDDINTADRVLNELTAMQREYLLELADACVVIRPAEGDIQLKQAVPLTGVGAASGAASGALWGTLIGLLFLNPLAGAVLGTGVGAASGVIAGNLSDYGIPDDFIREMGSTIKPDSSALFLLVERVKADRVLPRLEGVRGQVLKTSLSTEQEARLREALAGPAAPPAGGTAAQVPAGA